MTEEKRHSERERRRRSLDRGRDEDRQTRVRRRRKKESRRQAGMLWICPCLVFLGQEFCLLLSVLCRFPSIALPPPPRHPTAVKFSPSRFFAARSPFGFWGPALLLSTHHASRFAPRPLPFPVSHRIVFSAPHTAPPCLSHFAHCQTTTPPCSSRSFPAQQQARLSLFPPARPGRPAFFLPGSPRPSCTSFCSSFFVRPV